MTCRALSGQGIPWHLTQHSYKGQANGQRTQWGRKMKSGGRGEAAFSPVRLLGRLGKTQGSSGLSRRKKTKAEEKRPSWGSSTADPAEDSQTCPRPRSKPRGCRCCHLVEIGGPQFPTSGSRCLGRTHRGTQDVPPAHTQSNHHCILKGCGCHCPCFAPSPRQQHAPQERFYKGRLLSTLWSPEGDEVPGQNTWPPQTAE